jgi:hypothetical protein
MRSQSTYSLNLGISLAYSTSSHCRQWKNFLDLATNAVHIGSLNVQAGKRQAGAQTSEKAMSLHTPQHSYNCFLSIAVHISISEFKG